MCALCYNTEKPLESRYFPMINPELQKLAEEYGMKYDQAVCYGILEGYAATFLDGTGCSRLMLTTRFESPTDKDALMDLINRQDLKGKYGIRRLQIAKKVIHVAFRSGNDQLQKIRDFIAWFMPLLEQFGASKADICVQCQEPIAEEDAHWVLRDGATAFRMHKTCAEELKRQIGAQSKSPRITGECTLGKGVLGALLGGLLGGVLWLLLQLIHFYTPIAGMATGWLTLTGYSFMKGKASKLRIPIAAVCGVLGVGLGLFFSSVVPMLKQYGVRSFQLFFQLFSGSPDYRGDFLGSFFLGIIFLALGLFVTVKSASRRTTDMTVTDLQ